MKINSGNIEVLPSKNQLKLFGYENYINTFIKLYQSNKLPNVILLNGPKGLGKATFIYHFINYLLSVDEDDKYSREYSRINSNNKSYNLISNNIHPNFFLLDSHIVDENIKINQVRNALKFLNKSTYLKNLKIVMIDNAEHLNLNSANALLKSLEEPTQNTFFFIIHNSLSKILHTIKSRSIEFKIFFDDSKKINIFKNIIKNYNLSFDADSAHNNLYFDTPGNFLKYLLILDNSNIDISKDKLSCVFHFIEKYRSKNESELLNYASLFIEQFYNELSFNNDTNINTYFLHKYKTLKLIQDMKKFNLDKKNLLISLEDILKNEKR